ncbi:MAG: diaminopimelate decarboxylase [Thermoprotei archaeon]
MADTGWLTVASGHLRMDGIDLVELAERFGTPLYVTSELRLRQNYRKLFTAFSKAYPKVSVNYALKANPNPAIVSALRQEGCGADVSSLGELLIARMSGVPESKIVFSANNASKDELESAAHSSATVNFDDLEQFRCLIGNQLPEVVSFRLNPGFGSGEFPGIVTGGPHAKFGVPVNEIAECYRVALKAGVKRFGIHMMTGSNVADRAYFSWAASTLLNIAGKIANELGISFEFIDLGGGFGVPYREGEKPLDIEWVASSVCSLFREKSVELGLGEPMLVVEPGRFLVADTTVLLGRVHDVKRFGETMVGTDVGMNTLLRPALYGAYHRVLVANRMSEEASEKAHFVGQICENTDFMAKDRQVPQVHIGDCVAFLDAGAYGYSMSSTYNSRPRAAEILVCADGSVHTVRRRETFSDLVQGTSIPPHLL